MARVGWYKGVLGFGTRPCGELVADDDPVQRTTASVLIVPEKRSMHIPMSLATTARELST